MIIPTVFQARRVLALVMLLAAAAVAFSLSGVAAAPVAASADDAAHPCDTAVKPSCFVMEDFICIHHNPYGGPPYEKEGACDPNDCKKPS